MAADVAPELYSRISTTFNDLFYSDPVVRALYRNVADGKATYEEAHKFAVRAGEICSKALKSHLTAAALPNGFLYYNIAERTVKPALTQMHTLVDEVCQQVQTTLNTNAGVGLAAQSVPISGENEERIEYIASASANAETLEDAHEVLSEPVVNYAQHVTDEAVRRNADFQYSVGLSAKITRTAMPGCCTWCADLAGTYNYEDTKGSDVYRRHNFCRCTVTFESGKKRQNVWTKKTWEAPDEVLEERKTFGLTDERRADKIEVKRGISQKSNENLTVSGHSGTPKKAEPFSVIDHVNNAGNVDVRTRYNGSGLKGVDIHTHDHGSPKRHPYGQHGEHAHDYEWDEFERLRSKTTRELTDEERKENSDIL